MSYNRTYEALICEKQHMGPEHEGYHKELMLNYNRIRECLVPLVSSNFRQPPLLMPIDSGNIYQLMGDSGSQPSAPTSNVYVNASDCPSLLPQNQQARPSSGQPASAATSAGSQRLLRMAVGKSAPPPPPPPIMSPKPSLPNRNSSTPRKVSNAPYNEAATSADPRKTSKSNK